MMMDKPDSYKTIKTMAMSLCEDRDCFDSQGGPEWNQAAILAMEGLLAEIEQRTEAAKWLHCGVCPTARREARRRWPWLEQD